MESKRGKEERLAWFEHKQQTLEYNKLHQQRCQFYHNKKKQTDNENANNANYLIVFWNFLMQSDVDGVLKMMRACQGPWAPLRVTVSEGRAWAMECGQAGPGINHGAWSQPGEQ